MLKKHEILASSFDRLRMRSSVFNGLALMVSLSVRRAHREAMGNIVFQHPASASIQAALLVFFAGAAEAGIVAANLSVRAPVTGRALFPNTVECLNPIRHTTQRILEKFLRIQAVFEQLSVDPSVLKKNGEQSEERLCSVFPQLLPRLFA